MRRAFFVSMAPVVVAASAYGQAISVNGGAIQGTITDPSGAKVPGAVLVITNTDEGSKRTVKADSAGFYSVGPLNPGSYRVLISSPGFENLEVNTVVRTGTVSSGDFKLSVGQSSETVEVNAGSVQVNTEQVAVQDVITRDQIDTLPVNGRNFLDIAQIEPGVQLQSGQTFDPTKAGYSAISVSGVSGRTTRLFLDGQDITDETVGTTLYNVSEGSIDEFQLNRATQDVSGDVTSTGEVLVATRSGTNAVHGMAYYNFQDYRALFASQTPGKPSSEFQRNQYGGSVGGPILKDRVFYFANLERIQQSQAAPANLGALFAGSASSFGNQYATYGTPYKDTYMAGRLDANGPLHGHYFVRGNYNFNGAVANANDNYQTYVNRDNTWGFAGGADFASGRLTHSFRGSYEKFHNFIGDDTAGNGGVYNPLSATTKINGVPIGGQGLTLRYVAQNLYVGPNVDAPQATYQSDKQFRYDGTWTRGAHNIKFGFSLNRLEDGGFAAFYGLAPRLTETASTLLAGTVTAANPLGLGCNGVPGAKPCANDPINGYDASTLTIGNGQGFSTERAGFGLPGGNSPSWRFGTYLADSFKITPNFTFIAGLRWSVDTNRQNNDLALPTCSQLSSTVSYACAGQPGTTSIFSLFNSSFTKPVHQPYGDFGPQIGFNYSPGDHKTSLHAGAGIYYESDVFNNLINSRGNLLASGAFYASKAVCSNFQVTFPDGVVHSTSPNGTSLQVLCQESTAAQAAPQFVALQQAYQASTAANSTVTNGSFVGNTLSASGLYAPDYREPYSEQISGGIQRQLFRGGTIEADYVHDATLKISESLDLNHVGAARTFNLANATTAVNNTIAMCGGTSVFGIIQPGGCAKGSGGTAGAHYANISDFAKQGLDSGNVYDSGTNYRYAGRTNPGAFPGLNPNLGSGSFIQPVGRSGYDALQVVFREQKAHPAPGLVDSNLQVSYSLSRIVSSTGSGTSDQFFGGSAYDYDNPNQFIGRSGLDRTNQLSFGGSTTIKYGPQIGLVGHFTSALPSDLTLDTELANGGIFQSDVTGDGTLGDIAPGTQPGYFMHHIKGNNLQQYINNFNATQAGKLTPAGQAVANSGLITAAQLVQIQGAIQPIANLPQPTGLNNPTFRSVDLNLSYPIRLARLREGLSIVPVIAFYNVGNFSNFSSFAGTSGVTSGSGTNTAALLNTTSTGGPVNNTPGTVSGPNNFGEQSTLRTIRGAGTYDQGAPRSAEFQLHVNF